MANRPTPINRDAIAPVRKAHRARVATYGDGALDPALSPRRYQPYYDMLRFTGGSLDAAIERVNAEWDLPFDPPNRSSIIRYAQKHNWKLKFLQEVMDDQHWDTIGDAQIKALKMEAIEELGKIQRGGGGGSGQLRAIMLTLGLDAARRARAQQGFTAEKFDAPQPYDAIGDADLTPEQIRDRDEQDYLREVKGIS